MEIMINEAMDITTSHTLKEISILIENNTIERSKDNLIFWKNVWAVRIK